MWLTLFKSPKYGTLFLLSSLAHNYHSIFTFSMAGIIPLDHLATWPQIVYGVTRVNCQKDRKKEKIIREKKSTALSIPRQSPIQVQTQPNIA